MSRKIYCDNNKCNFNYDSMCTCYDLSMSYNEDLTSVICQSDTTIEILLKED